MSIDLLACPNPPTVCKGQSYRAIVSPRKTHITLYRRKKSAILAKVYSDQIGRLYKAVQVVYLGLKGTKLS